MDNINKVRREKKKLNSPARILSDNFSRQCRLKVLVDIHGIELVAEACGFAVSTLTQYLRVKHPLNIGEDSVRQAETIFKQI